MPAAGGDNYTDRGDQLADQWFPWLAYKTQTTNLIQRQDFIEINSFLCVHQTEAFVEDGERAATSLRDRGVAFASLSA